MVCCGRIIYIFTNFLILFTGRYLFIFRFYIYSFSFLFLSKYLHSTYYCFYAWVFLFCFCRVFQIFCAYRNCTSVFILIPVFCFLFSSKSFCQQRVEVKRGVDVFFFEYQCVSCVLYCLVKCVSYFLPWFLSILMRKNFNVNLSFG